MTEEERRETNEKLEMLQSIVRTFELKTKNAQDHSKCVIFYVLTLFIYTARTLLYSYVCM